MSANVRCDVWHLYFVNLIIAFDRMIEPMLPVHCHFRHALRIKKQKPGVATHHLFEHWSLSVLYDRLEASEHAIRRNLLDAIAEHRHFDSV
jgi:hypothetical protein